LYNSTTCALANHKVRQVDYHVWIA
jgi:hypothetical protein